MKGPALAAALVLTCLSAHTAADAPAQSTSARIVGKWTWTRTDTKCVETQEYRADGTLTVVSGAEKSSNTYVIAPEATANGFHKLTVKIVKDTGGKDCFDIDKDNTGTTATHYVMIHPSGDKLMLCHDDSKDYCVGPYQRDKQ
jgi:hypothetical protein